MKNLLRPFWIQMNKKKSSTTYSLTKKQWPKVKEAIPLHLAWLQAFSLESQNLTRSFQKYSVWIYVLTGIALLLTSLKITMIFSFFNPTTITGLTRGLDLSPVAVITIEFCSLILFLTTSAYIFLHTKLIETSKQHSIHDGKTEKLKDNETKLNGKNWWRRESFQTSGYGKQVEICYRISMVGSVSLTLICLFPFSQDRINLVGYVFRFSFFFQNSNHRFQIVSSGFLD